MPSRLFGKTRPIERKYVFLNGTAQHLRKEENRMPLRKRGRLVSQQWAGDFAPPIE